ncbi:MAG TPA: DNA recombination protein RmuC [Sphingomicrobium sp.]|nr:DNA recombination protein RmuC [Sphingomicrobium sp.]
MDTSLIIVAIVALAIGALIGWLFAGRETAGARQTVENLRMQLDGIVAERDAARSEIGPLSAEVARLRAEAEHFDQRMKDLAANRDALATQFREIGDQLLEKAHKDFLSKAGERFTEADKATQAKLQSLLQPVEATLKRYEEGLQRVEKEREGSYRELQQAVAQLSVGNDQVRKETQRLANVMGSSPKARGRWGEEQLRTILEAAGLAENVDFSLQESVSDGERQLRPDCVISLPGDRTIVIDVKCPLVAFEQAFDEDDDVRRSELLRQHAAALKSYAADLGKKGYWRQFEKSPDFVIMFVPGEHFLSAAAERAPDLIETAFRNGVIIASTINMLALAKIMAGMWRQEALNAQAQELGRVGSELHGRLATLAGHIARLGRNLEQANGNFNAMVGSLESQVMTSAKRFEELGAGSGKPIEPLPMVEAAPRPLTKLASPKPADNEDAA